MRVLSRKTDESGVVLVITLLVMVLISGVMAGMFAAINADQRSHGIDRDQTQVYAAAHAGLEKLTSDLMALFLSTVSPTPVQIDAVAALPPTIAGFEYVAPGGVAGSGYDVAWTPDPTPGPNFGNPLAMEDTEITAGPYTGFKGLITRFDLTVTAVSPGGSEVRLRRGLQTVAVPVFQFGVFSESDLTFYAGDNFNFGGRVHTNGSLFVAESQAPTGALAAGVPAGMTFSDRITAFGEVVRQRLSNNQDPGSFGFAGAINVATAIGTPGTFRNLRYTPVNEGSVVGMPGSAPNPNWRTISTATYRNNIRTRLTGATRLDLPLVSQGAFPIDLIRRPVVNSNEDVANQLVFRQRYFRQASLRILLSDRAADITGLPTVNNATAPVQLDGDWVATPPAGYGPAACAAPNCVDATHPPIARSIGLIANTTAAGSAIAGGFATIRVVTAPGIADGFITATVGRPLTATAPLGALTTPITCTGKTLTTFFGCTVPVPGLVALSVIRANLPAPWGTPVSATITNAAVAAGVNRTINLGAGFTTLPFTAGLMWVGGQPVTCEGYDTLLNPQRFTNCRGLTVAPGAGVAVSTEAHVNPGTGTIGGFIKIEKRDDDTDNWIDVTMEILNLGIGAPNQALGVGAPTQGTLCPDPTPFAVLRIQRLRDNANPAVPAAGQPGCTYAASRDAFDWWPNGLYDAREGNYRQVAPAVTTIEMGGVMQYISLDVFNLKRWLNNTVPGIPGTGNTVFNHNGDGYIVYFSDRRGNHDWTQAGDPETGEYGWEDVVNPLSGAGVPSGALEAGENVNPVNQTGALVGNATLDVYGASPGLLVIPALSNATVPFDRTNPGLAGTSAHPTRDINAGKAQVNRTVLFRRALKLVNGGIVAGPTNNLPDSGLTVVAENPVYVQGNYNATAVATAEPNRPAAVMADAVTLLSTAWTDANSFRNPNSATNRNAVTTGYRFAVVAGKSLSFQWPAAGGPQFLFGTDGGVGNFLRLLEDWNPAGISINYRGSIVSLYNSRQATGTYKFNTDVYNFGARSFTFDNDFLTPALLPAGTPMFRDVNTLTFRQILRPNDP